MKYQITTIFSIISILFFIGIFSVLPTVSAEVPEWIKNNAKWWSEGKISEQEYLNSIRFLIDNNIITIETVYSEIKSRAVEEYEKTIAPKLEDRFVRLQGNYLDSIVVKFHRGELAEEITLDTFARFHPGTDLSVLSNLRELGYTSYFLLESLPSKDKTDFYELISKYVNRGKKPERFDVSITGFMNDGSKLITTNYRFCEAREYTLYTQDLKIVFQFTDELEEEIRDRIVFYCRGGVVGNIGDTFPETQYGNENNPVDNFQQLTGAYVIPSLQDRAMSYVVHFFDGDLDKLYSFDTFKVFSPSITTRENPFVAYTESGNPFDSNPQFFLKSLPSKEKSDFYKLLSRFINPGKEPEKFDVSVDLVTGDGTILQRWSYANCEVSDYTSHFEEYSPTFTYSGQEGPEIREKTDFKCSRLNHKVNVIDPIDYFPILTGREGAVKNSNLEIDILDPNNRAMSYEIRSFGGELEETYTYSDFRKFESLSEDRPLKPANHPKQYEYGFFVESNPSHEKTELYEFFSRYINTGKADEPYNVDIDVKTGDGTVLYTLKYQKCSAIDLIWYLQDLVFYPTLSKIPTPETRERYTFYCEGLQVGVP